MRLSAMWLLLPLTWNLGLVSSADAQAGSADTSDFNVCRFGAVGDGKALSTSAFSAAIAACAQAGGGTVWVPPGAYLIGAIELKSHVRLYIEPGATLLASQNAADYPLVEDVWFPGEYWISSLIYASDAQDISVCGRGTIDGQGANWWAPILAAKRQHRRDSGSAATNPASASIDPKVPDARPGLPKGRPQLIRFLRCSNVLIEGVSLLDSPEWNIHPLLCERVRIDGVSITARVPSPNTDGINPESCRGVQIVNCRIDNGDDCITLKSGEDEAGRRIGRPDEDITISNCITYHGHGGVSIGSEMSGGIRNVAVSNCVFHGTDNGIRIKSQRGRGGVIEGVSFSNIVMEDVPHPFVITSFYSGRDKPGDVFPVSDGTPRFGDILISNVTARGAADAGSITGLREMPISGVTFSNVHVQALHGFQCRNAADVRFNESVFDIEDSSGISAENCTNVETGGLRVVHPRP